MNTIDISDLAFSLSNYSAVNEMLNSTTETIPELITETIPELITETIPELITETIPDVLNNVVNTNIVSEPSDINMDDQTFLYLGIGLIVVTIIGIFTYNYYKNKNKNKHVHFQENIENEQPSYNEYKYYRSEI
jgi:hypothetical protein